MLLRLYPAESAKLLVAGFNVIIKTALTTAASDTGLPTVPRFRCHAGAKKPLENGRKIIMVVVNVTVEIDPQHLDAIKEGIAAMESASRAEVGCLDYTFSVELNDSSKLRITEKWETMGALTAHFQAPHMAAFQALMGSYPPKGMQAFFYEAEEVTPPGR